MKGSLCQLAETSFLWRDTAMRIRERFNPRAPCGARHWPVRHLAALPQISTHAPLAGHDFNPLNFSLAHLAISTHAPLAGHDRATGGAKNNYEYFNPRAPCGARRGYGAGDVCKVDISTHAPLAGHDGDSSFRRQHRNISTHAPLAGHDAKILSDLAVGGISTHAPLAGHDKSAALSATWQQDFNPRAPCGARQI